MVCWPLGTCAKAFLIQCPRQRCHVAPEHASNRVTQSVMGVADHQLDAAQAVLDQPLDEARPERFGLRRAEAEADDLALSLGIHGDNEYRRHRDDAAAVANL